MKNGENRENRENWENDKEKPGERRKIYHHNIIIWLGDTNCKQHTGNMIVWAFWGVFDNNLQSLDDHLSDIRYWDIVSISDVSFSLAFHKSNHIFQQKFAPQKPFANVFFRKDRENFCK